MGCDNCGDDNIVQIKFKIDGEDHWVSWDENEAKKYGFHSVFDNEPFPLSDIIASVLQKNLPARYDSANNPKCPNCGLSFIELLDIGRIGCAQCYAAFGEQMEVLLEKVHGTKTHVGHEPMKKPRQPQKPAKRLSKKDRLEIKLNNAIETEDYEQAARLRDQIKELETARR